MSAWRPGNPSSRVADDDRVMSGMSVVSRLTPDVTSRSPSASVSDELVSMCVVENGPLCSTSGSTCCDVTIAITDVDLIADG